MLSIKARLLINSINPYSEFSMEQQTQSPTPNINPASEKNVKMIVFILLGITVLGIALFIIFPGIRLSNEFTYKNTEGEKFEFVTGYAGKVPIYTLKVSASYGDQLIKQYEIPLRNKPQNLKAISVDAVVRQKILNSRGIFITMQPELDQKAAIAGIQLAKVLGTADYGIFKIPTQGAFTEAINTTAGQDYPVKTCQDATPDIRVIMLTLGGENMAYVAADCVIIKATDADNLIKVAEAVVLKLLNVL